MLDTIDIRDGVIIQDTSDNLMSVGSNEYTLLLEHTDILYGELNLVDKTWKETSEGTGVDFILYYKIQPMSKMVKMTISAHYGDYEVDFEIGNENAKELLKDTILAWVSERLAV